VYDVTGRLVRSLVPGVLQDAGRYSIEWDGRDESGGVAAAGLYFSRLEAGGQRDARRLVRMH
jgi:flagellar hook assembly protein FlgD